MESKTFILFIFGMFEDQEDIEYFCLEVLGKSPAVKTIRFVIEKSQNIIVIFESELGYKDLSNELYSLLFNDNIKFYFVFDRHSLVSAHLPKEVKDFVFKPNDDNDIIKLEYEKKKSDDMVMDLDSLLDKIEEMGIESLTPEEKNFLDNFEG